MRDESLVLTLAECSILVPVVYPGYNKDLWNIAQPLGPHIMLPSPHAKFLTFHIS